MHKLDRGRAESCFTVRGGALAVVLMAFVLASAGTYAAEAPSACNLELAAPTSILRLRYDPFDATPAKAGMVIQIRNTGGAPCEAAVALFRVGPAQASANGPDRIDYDITDHRGASTLVEGLTPSATLPPGAGATVRVAAGSTASLELTAMARRGQIVPPADYSDALDIGLYRATAGGYERVLGGNRLHIIISAVAVMRLSLAGGGRKTTLNFGELSEGATRSVMLQAYANQGFRLHASSENGGSMQPLDAAAKAEGGWQAPYTVSLNRAGHLGLEAEQIVDITPAATGLSGIAIPVEVRIGSIARLRAGLYRDVITLTATPRM